MNVFISWSGDRSKELAKALSELLPDVIQSLKVWMSEQDIMPGSRWAEALNQKLETCNFGVLCLTPENLNAPWLLFEAGSLAKSVSGSKVVPYYLGLKPADIPFPLAQFQCAGAEENGTRRLVHSLNLALESPIDETRLRRGFEGWWPSLKSRIEVILASAIPNDPAPAVREIELERQRHEINATKIALKAILDKHELWPLQGLNGPKPVMIPFEPNLYKYLHRLDGLNFIQPNKGFGLWDIVQEHKDDEKLPYNERPEFDLKKYVYITDDGKRYLKTLSDLDHL